MSLEFWSLFIRGETNEKILPVYTNTFTLYCQINMKGRNLEISKG